MIVTDSARPTATYDRVYPASEIANGGGRFPLQGRTWFNTMTTVGRRRIRFADLLKVYAMHQDE